MRTTSLLCAEQFEASMARPSKFSSDAETTILNVIRDGGVDTSTVACAIPWIRRSLARGEACILSRARAASRGRRTGRRQRERLRLDHVVHDGLPIARQHVAEHSLLDRERVALYSRYHPADIIAQDRVDRDQALVERLGLMMGRGRPMAVGARVVPGIPARPAARRRLELVDAAADLEDDDRHAVAVAILEADLVPAHRPQKLRDLTARLLTAGRVRIGDRASHEARA